MAKGKGSVITPNISVTPMEVAEGVSTECFAGEGFSSSPRLDSAIFRFLDIEGFGDVFGLFDSLFFLFFSTDL
jgi:hypothetical protein